MWEEGIFGNSVPCAQFCCEPKTALKNGIFLNLGLLHYRQILYHLSQQRSPGAIKNGVEWSGSRSIVSDSFATPWTAACQAPLSMEFSRQEYWSG